MQRVVRTLDDFLSELGEILSTNDLLREPWSSGYESVDEVMKEIESPEPFLFILRAYREELTSLLLSEAVPEPHVKECISLISMIEELEFYLEAGNRTEFFFRAYEVYFFTERLLSRISTPESSR